MSALARKTAGCTYCNLGQVSWTYLTKGLIHDAEDCRGHVLRIDDHELHAVNFSTSRALDADTGEKVRSSPMVAHELVRGTEAGDLAAVDYRGTPRWRFQAARSPPPAASDQALFHPWTARLTA
jgi:hypothetical protein